MSRAFHPMTHLDRTALLHALDVRHDQLLNQLDDLNEEIERALNAVRPEIVEGAGRAGAQQSGSAPSVHRQSRVL